MRISPIHLDEDTAGVLRRDRVVIGAGFAVGAGLFVWRVGVHAVLPALLVFALLAAALVVCDVRLTRLPDPLTLPAYPLLAALLAIPLDGAAYVRALIAAAAMFVGHFLLALFVGGIGLGDAKAAGPVGMVLGWVSWAALVQAMVIAYVCVGVYAIGLAVARRATRGSVVPFGPFLLGAAVLVLAVTGA
ncbi:prepilin peptidase [Streptomyces sp. SID3343]|uniref:prepilin peptidase n=1 Tax=Streptomyces sp. SID3343 TaxID=2690260 RepID=UPI001371E168|nr:prepilin peptidase [Streptomyces sp. SID3343]